MMKHRTEDYVPDQTYFRIGDVEPSIGADTVVLYTGTGTHRSWGHPGVTSTVVIDEHDFLAVHIGFYHKHGGGQTWRYYTESSDGIEQVGWRSLSDEVRQIVLDAPRPRWAKSPGKLRSEYKVPRQEKRTTYKAVRVADGRFWSLYDGATEYVLGTRLAQAVGKGAGNDYGYVTHNGGYYSHPSVERVKELLDSGKLVPDKCLDEVSELAIIECTIGGRIAEFPNGKLASTYLTPEKIVGRVVL
jgi:hypothetical protein